MKITHVLALGSYLLPSLCSAAPFLVCDPYPTTVQQPTEFVVTISGLATPITSPAVAVTGGKAFEAGFGTAELEWLANGDGKGEECVGRKRQQCPFHLHRWESGRSWWSFSFGPIITVRRR